MTDSSRQFFYVSEQDDAFLSLFPHRFDYIYAEYPHSGQKPAWKTESRHPLADRLVRQGGFLFGVRFGVQTQYCLLDIDRGSPYHPSRDPLAIGRIRAALEPIGLVAAVVCTSSESGGLHLYFPFRQAQRSWELAATAAALLENAGFCLKPGELELFPNPKPYTAEGKISLFNAHRLPMQRGSYLLNADFQPIWSNPQAFVQQWEVASDRNWVEASVLRQLLKQVKRKQYRLSGKADKFLNDLNAEIEVGWTGYGQTNRLLGRIALRAYVFYPWLTGGTPLTGTALVEEIVATARSLPGYQEWCRHQHEIEQRAGEWVRCVENSRYFPYGTGKGKCRLKEEIGVSTETSTETSTESVHLAPSWNQKQLESTRERIRLAIADLLEREALPAGTTARFRALLTYGIGGASLYRHRDLWHPQHLVENPPHPPTSQEQDTSDCVETTSDDPYSPSLFPPIDSDTLQLQASGDRSHSNSRFSGSNPSIPGGVGGLAAVLRQPAPISSSLTSSHTERMQQFLESGDPILVAEARMWQCHLGRSVLPATVASSACAHSSPVEPAAFTSWVEQVREDKALTARYCDPTDPTHFSSLCDLSDLSDLLAAISIHLEWLGWTGEQVRDRLFSLFGKRSQARLSPTEVVEWLEQLEQAWEQNFSLYGRPLALSFSQQFRE